MRTHSLARQFLIPMIPMYRLGVALRGWRLRRGWEPVRRLQFPVISIGNLSAGGAGKTPFAIALARLLAGRGYGVDVLSRGYGRCRRDAARVDPAGTPEEFGDEPLLIARETGLPVYVARQRYEAGLLAEEHPAGATPCADKEQLPVHILDDGFQHRQLHRDVDILLLNREDWRDKLLPAGNLRESRGAARRADVIVVPDGDEELEGNVREWGWKGPVWCAGRRVEVPRVDGPVLAFCGIARPEQFFAGLEAAGLRLAGRIAFRDHHRYSAQDVEKLQGRARMAGARALVTTQKDEMRLRTGDLETRQAGCREPWFPNLLAKDARKIGHGDVFDAVGLPVFTAGLRIEIAEETAALDWLSSRLRDTANRSSL
jgi:tetraacyldisaccharide 4'-kinase